jgi:hypothetical protein
MAYIEGHARDQELLLLLPASVEDYVAADTAVRFIDAFVDDPNLSAAGFQRTQLKAAGRPGYDPADMLKFYPRRVFGRSGSQTRRLCLSRWPFLIGNDRRAADAGQGTTIR